MDQFAFDFAPARRVYSVTELNAAIRAALENEFPDIWVSGEISGAKLAPSGHYYFTLKEAQAQVRAVAFRSAHRYWKFKPQDGLAVLARGRIDVFEARGEYQLIVDLLEPLGHGALQVAFEQLKKKLAEEGLFEPTRKRPLPRYPQRIGIVTSPRGAVISDMVQILARRFPGLHIRLFPALMQGEGSVEDVCRGLDYFSRHPWAELVILARGGGSLEDLWTFNEEAVARAIARCAVPVVSAVGHETDVTIADFVADLRAPTPSAAAEMIVCTRQELLDRIAGREQKLVHAMRYHLAVLARRWQQQGIERPLGLLHRAMGRQAQRVDELEFRLRDLLRSLLERHARAQRTLAARLNYFDLRPRFAADRRRLDQAHAAAAQSLRWQLARRRGAVEQLSAKLSQLSPLLILDRGYAIVTNLSGSIVKDSAAAPPASSIEVRLARGRLNATVSNHHPGAPRQWPS
ncbi:MAG TPA: exodeoxyribonuclease VII large subunit [Bryobacteraceae bacterium]|nr:exodeoxyribonuclease VII large subunit [Bryobacteraceae bacterium]